MNAAIRKVGLIFKRHDPHVRSIVTEVVPWLQARGIEVFLEQPLTDQYPVKAAVAAPEIMVDRVDLVAVFGGDGTLLYAARLVAGSEKPIMGVNLGALGFLTEVRLEEMWPALEAVLSGNYLLDARMLLDVEVLRRGTSPVRYLALNDGVINRGTLARIIDLEISVDSEKVTRTRADGLIVATPTGSTAYSLAAGGPILHPGMNALIITPICPHTLTNRPVVIPAGATVGVSLRHGTEVMLTIDGQVGTALEQDDTVVFRKAANSLRLVRVAGSSFFRLLREKLKWS